MDVTTAPPAAAGPAPSPAALNSSVAGAAHSGPADGCLAAGASAALGGAVAPIACGASDEVATLRAAAAVLAAAVAGARGWSGPDRQGVLVELNLTIDTLSAVRSSLLVV